MPKEHPAEHLYRIVASVPGDPGITLPQLVERFGGKYGLSDGQAADGVVQAIAMGYIAAPLSLTEKGKRYLESEREKAKKKG
jgi:hypothetical protein